MKKGCKKFSPESKICKMARGRSSIDALILKIMEAKDLALKMKRFRAYRKLDEALSEAGWELADIEVGNIPSADKLGK